MDKGYYANTVDRNEEEMADLNQIIHSVSKVATSQIGQKANLQLELKELPKLRCRAGHLGQVFLNMLLNSGQAIKQERGRIKVSSVLADDEVKIKISDNGCGIAESDMNRIYDPFFTTQEVGSGTGLGLSVCLDIVQAHDGRIDVESQEGKGTTFTITLPVKE